MSRPISASFLERKLRSIVGAGGNNLLPDLADLKGLLVLESDRAEWQRAGGEQPAAAGGGFAAVAGNTSVVQLRNPVGSGVLAVITRVSAVLGAAGRLRIWEAFSIADFATVFVTQVNRDLRDVVTVGDSLACILTGLNSVGAAGSGRNPLGWEVAARTTLEMIGEKDEIIIPEGKAVMVDTTLVNASLDVNFFWRERPIEGEWELR